MLRVSISWRTLSGNPTGGLLITASAKKLNPPPGDDEGLSHNRQGYSAKKTWRAGYRHLHTTPHCMAKIGNTFPGVSDPQNSPRCLVSKQLKKQPQKRSQRLSRALRVSEQKA